ncbi:hypothetical protein P8452_14965 [Trifolium repens]|nr:hypothetical protein P8452_14965 [Trifolium repens]
MRQRKKKEEVVFNILFAAKLYSTQRCSLGLCFVSMSLTFEITAETLLEQSLYTTVFAPSDFAFKKSGQTKTKPPLQLHQSFLGLDI